MSDLFNNTNFNSSDVGKGLDLKPHKIIRIAVSGDVFLNKIETKIIDTRDFQRLRRLKQLGSVNLVFPTATHTRFDHSLGTVDMAQRMIHSIRENKHNVDDEGHIKRDEEQLIRLLALLHDISHLPYGHTLEDEFRIFLRHDEDTRRIDRFVGRDSDIGKIILEDLGEEIYSRFYALITTDKENLNQLGNDHFIYDLVNNTVCADLLDYLRRDTFYCNLPLGLDYRFLNFLHLFKDKSNGTRRVAVRLWKDGQTKPRPDLLNELVTLLEFRYKLGEIAYFHHTKLASGAMIAGAVMRAREAELLKVEDLYDLGDEELIYKLKNLDNERVRSLTDAFHYRKIWKQQYVKSASQLALEQSEDKTRDIITEVKNKFHSNADHRYAVEKQICEELGIKDGDFLIHCPDYKMAEKKAEMLVLWNGKYKPLGQCLDDNILSKKLKLILESHRNLWAIRCFMNPDSGYSGREVESACNYYFESNDYKRDKAKQQYYEAIIDNVVLDNIDTTKLNFDDYYKAKELALTDIIEGHTNLKQSRKSLKSLFNRKLKGIEQNR